jgi:hypothetical protein
MKPLTILGALLVVYGLLLWFGPAAKLTWIGKLPKLPVPQGNLVLVAGGIALAFWGSRKR